MTISNVPIPKRGMLLVFGTSATIESYLLKPLRAAERTDGPELSIYNDKSEVFSGTSFLTPDTADYFAEKLLHEMHSRLVVMTAAVSGNFPSRFREFLFTKADQAIVFKNDDEYLRGIVSHQRVKKFGVVPIRPPDPRNLKPDEAIVVSRLRLNGVKVHGPRKWDKCQVMKFKIPEATTIDQVLRR